MEASAPQPDGSELASKLVSLLSISVMSILFGIKTFNVQFKYLTYSRWLVLTLYIISWGFTCAATLFVSTNNQNLLSCFLSEMACDIFYSATKIIIYGWLIEKVWVVSSVRKSRWKTKSYRIHMMLLAPYSGIAAIMIVFHIAEIEESGICIIGLKPVASIPLLIFNLYFTILFVLPLIRIGRSVQTDWKSSRLHEVALRTLAASTVCLFVSFANILALVILNGRERGVLCLTCCTVDVTINVITIHWVTSNPAGKTSKDHVYSMDNKETSTPDRRTATTDEQTQMHQRLAQKDLYNVGIDEYIASNTTPAPPGEHAGGTLGYMGDESRVANEKGGAAAGRNELPGYLDSNDLMGTTTGVVPMGRETQYRYVNGRFMMITSEKGDDDDDSSSIQESQSSRKSLTKPYNS
ncbi:hypothetical protein O0I10_005743 [Lichtheimia ornata]|uniref:Uncharacterized protein n=1 Tax=Lichtheimia ornata TaxID=688661 RepID=A0AAD7V689_9FUNG|nr:uncharacterized protein O0I10_005743 [Lichtheimia ornata]KAJ8658391.1 hypothetical protein O0I10_005743 [Lichtheimia ornata]